MRICWLLILLVGCVSQPTIIKQQDPTPPRFVASAQSQEIIEEPPTPVTNSTPFMYNQPLTNCWIESRQSLTVPWSNDYDHHFDTNNDGLLSLVPNHPTNHLFYRVGGEVIQ